MLDDLRYGTRNKRGDWKPAAVLRTGPLFSIPFRPLDVLKWIPSYFLPWNIAFMGTAAVTWSYLTPSTETTRALAPGWITYLILRNMIAVFLFFGAFEMHLYVRRRQGSAFKYNAKWPADARSDTFLFGRQNLDNMIRTLLCGVPVWTAYEVLALWCFSNGWARWLGYADHPVYLASLALLVPMIHEVHFFCLHRLIHWPPLYRAVHSVHHNSVNVSPWSSLSMHPVEHLLYFSSALVHLVLPSHPLLAIYQLQSAGLGSVVGHVGFDRIVVGGGTVDPHTYAHYLHHKYFEVNYADGMIPLDRWFGTWHDGSAGAEAAMNARMQARAAKLATRGRGAANA